MSDDQGPPILGRADRGASDSLWRRAVLRAVEEGVPWEPNAAPLPVDEARRVIQDLRIHQIELEIQNEELLRVQGELAASHARYVDLYDRAPVAYLTLLGDGLIQEANITAARLLGVARSTLAGRHFTDFLEPADQDIWHLEFRGLIEDGTSRSFELRIRGTGPAVVWGSMDLSLVRDEEGKALIRVVVSDISQRKREELARRQLEARLSQADKVESLGRMAGAIAHRFNNLLGVIIGNVELGLADLDRATEAGEALADAIGAAREAAEVSGLLLDYLGQNEGVRTVQDLSQICRQSLPALRELLPAEVHLQMDLPARGPFVNAAAGEITRVLTILATNAGEASAGDHGSVHVSLRTVPAWNLPTGNRVPESWTPGDGPHACLSVTDTGGGIDTRIMGQIFDPFFTTKGFGRGLGLPIAVGTVAAHGGGIRIRSVPGGTTVEVYLPICAEGVPVDSGGPDLERPSVRARGGTMMLVDDDEGLRKVGARMLERLGLTVIQARGGEQAVAVYRERRDEIDWVLCDLTMPGLNGWQTLDALRKLDPGVCVFLTSGFDEAHAMSAEHAERPDGFLAKPWTAERLSAMAGLP